MNHRGLSLNFQSILGKGLIPGGKEKDKARQAVFLTPTNPFGDDPEEEEPHDDFTVQQKASYVTKYCQKAVYWVRLSKAQDQGLEFWQTKSFAIMTHATIHGDCTDRVTSQNGERVDFERLETPRPVPKVTLKKNWQSQQQQHSSSCTDVPSLVKTMAVKEHWSGAQDSSELSTGVRTCSGKLGQIASDTEIDTVLKRKMSTTWSHRLNLWMKRRIPKWWKESKLVRTKICVRNDLAKKNMMFSQESCQATVEMGNVELIELKKSRVQCPIVCTHYAFEGTIICSCGKHIRSNQEMIQHIRKAFDVLKTHCFRASHPNSRGYKHVSQLWQQHHHRKKDRTFSNILDRWENDLEYSKSPKKPSVGTMRLYDISTTSYILISLTQHLLNIQADKAIWYIYVVWRGICVACRW